MATNSTPEIKNVGFFGGATELAKFLVEQGVSMASNVTFKNPVPLKPIRTFAEIDQPESNFTLRVNDSAQAALFEADGGVWKNVAVALIKDYLKSNLYGCNVSVIA